MTPSDECHRRGLWLVVNQYDFAARREPGFEETAGECGVAMKHPDADGEDLVELAPPGIEVKHVGDMKFRSTRGDVFLISALRRRDHFLRFVDRDEPTGTQALADEARGHAMTATDLQDAVVRLNPQSLDNRS